MQEDLWHNLELACTSPTVPSDVVTIILGATQFLEHDEKEVGIESRVLGDFVSSWERNDAISVFLFTDTVLGPNLPRTCHSAALQGAGIPARPHAHGR